MRRRCNIKWNALTVVKASKFLQVVNAAGSQPAARRPRSSPALEVESYLVPSGPLTSYFAASDQRYIVGNHTNAHTIDTSIKHVAIMSR